MLDKNAIFTLAAAAVLALPAGAWAQQTSPRTATLPQDAARMEDSVIDNRTMKEFADVHQEVEAVSLKYQAEIQRTADAAERGELAEEANAEMMRIVESSSLSVREYNRIAMLVQNDPKLQQQYQRALKQ